MHMSKLDCVFFHTSHNASARAHNTLCKIAHPIAVAGCPSRNGVLSAESLSYLSPFLCYWFGACRDNARRHCRTRIHSIPSRSPEGSGCMQLNARVAMEQIWKGKQTGRVNFRPAVGQPRRMTRVATLGITQMLICSALPSLVARQTHPLTTRTTCQPLAIS